MYRIRFHGRGGQGIKTASRILGTAFFLQGYEVQDAPRYGAERRGAPVFAYVRASKKRINERGIIRTPDLVVVADDSLFGVCPAILTEGITRNTLILVNTPDISETIQAAVHPGIPVIISGNRTTSPGTLCAASSAALCGVITRECLEEAILQELASLDRPGIEENTAAGLDIFDRMTALHKVISESEDTSTEQLMTAAWTGLKLKDTWQSVPAVHRGRTAALNRTGSWRTERPLIDYNACSGCMLCALYCPDSVISAGTGGRPVIDYDHCKGCMVCSCACPVHAISRTPEHPSMEKKL